MHKVSNINFAVLRDSNPYELVTPEEQPGAIFRH